MPPMPAPRITICAIFCLLLCNLIWRVLTTAYLLSSVKQSTYGNKLCRISRVTVWHLEFVQSGGAGQVSVGAKLCISLAVTAAPVVFVGTLKN